MGTENILSVPAVERKELSYIISTMDSSAGMDEDTIRRVLENANEFILSESLGQDELDVILRDDAFEKPVFYKGKTFLHDKFGDYMIRQFNIIRFKATSNAEFSKQIQKKFGLKPSRRTIQGKKYTFLCPATI